MTTTEIRTEIIRLKIVDLKYQSQSMETKLTIQKLQQELDGLIQRKTNGV